MDLCSEEMASKVKDMLLLCNNSCQVNQSYKMCARYTKSMIHDYSSVFEHFQARTQGGFEGVRSNPLFDWVWVYCLCDTLTLDDGLVRRTMARDSRIIL